jgi:hypothetical protein
VKPQQAARWAQVRQQGQWTFIWRVGILRWGLAMCVAFVAMQAAQQPNRILFIFALNVPLWACGGALFGFSMWHYGEWAYRRYLARTSVRDTAL